MEGRVANPVIFYGASARAFALKWSTAVDGRWAFPLAGIDEGYIAYVCMRMLTMGNATDHILIASTGAAGWFGVGPDDAPVDAQNTVGIQPANRRPLAWAETVSAWVEPKTTLSVLCDSTGAGNGFTMLRSLAASLGAQALCSDGPVVRKADGTATTTGNIYLCLAGAEPFIKFPAPSGGNTQPFPLTPVSA